MVDFESHRRRPAVDDQLDTAAQVGEHVLRGCRRHVSRAVRRRRHQRAADRGQDVARDRMAGNPHGDRIEARGGKFRHRAIRTPGQHQGEGARPERRRQPFGVGVEAGKRPRGGSVGHVRDERIERRSALGLIEAGDRLGVGGVGAEPIDGLGGEGDEAARGEHARGQRGGRATLGRTVPGRLRLYHSGCRWRAHRGYLCLRRRGRRL